MVASSVLYPTRPYLHATCTWLQDTDGSGAAVRVVLFDCRKAFDLSDHTLLVRKGFGLPIPLAVAFWVADFLTHRQQRVKLSGDCFSEWGPVPDSVPQGTKLGLSLFLRVPRVDIWKYVDGTIIPFFEEPNQ